MEQFSKHLDKLQAAILSTEIDDDAGRLCECTKEVAVYRCVDCSFSRVLCRSCINETHYSNPFHRVQKWTGFFFERIPLSELGRSIKLGHRGQPCPNRLQGSEGRATKVVHSNGIHEVRVEYCHCFHAPSEPEQLAQSFLFPATLERPETVFTFAVLKQFHILGLTAKTSAYDFFNALVNMTNNAFPKKVPVSTYSRCLQLN